MCKHKIKNMRLMPYHLLECDVDGIHFVFVEGSRAVGFWRRGEHRWLPRKCELTADLCDDLLEEMNRSVPMEKTHEHCGS